MLTIFIATAMVTLFLSAMAFILGVYCLIKIKSAEQSKFEFIQADAGEMFETDVNKINEELEDEEFEKEMVNKIEPNKQFNEVII